MIESLLFRLILHRQKLIDQELGKLFIGLPGAACVMGRMHNIGATELKGIIQRQGFDVENIGRQR